jgi:hypothetical protein
LTPLPRSGGRFGLPTIVAALADSGEAMDRPKKTQGGFTVSRRCDACGTKCTIVVDEGDLCILKCLHCGKEYNFRSKST